MATRKENKLRPYRVDYFDVAEMIDNDKALVRSKIVRAVTAAQAQDMVLSLSSADGRPILHNDNRIPIHGRFVVKSYRFYKKLSEQPKKKVYKAVEDLYTSNKAVKIMELIEGIRQLAPSNTDNSCDHGNATNAPIGVCTHGETPIPAPASGPDSMETKEIIQDMQGMLAHDQHEQAMDSFVPAPGQPSLPVETPATCPSCNSADRNERLCVACVSGLGNRGADDHPHDEFDECTDGWHNALTPEQPLPTPTARVGGDTTEALGDVFLPARAIEVPKSESKSWYIAATKGPEFKDTTPLPIWAKVMLFGGVAVATVLLVLAILHCHG